jgi:hypothetical protein
VDVDALEEESPPGQILADEIASNLQSLRGVGEVSVPRSIRRIIRRFSEQR